MFVFKSVSGVFLTRPCQNGSHQVRMSDGEERLEVVKREAEIGHISHDDEDENTAEDMYGE